MANKINKKGDVARFWRAHFRKLGAKDSGIVGKKIVCRRIDGDELGYTSEGNPPVICLNPEHEIAPKGMEQKVMFLDGVNCHEVGHQLFTDFRLYKRVQDGLSIGKFTASLTKKVGFEPDRELKNGELYILHSFFNIVEDTSIEYWLHKKIGGQLIKALDYTVARTFKTSPRIEEIEEPFGQLQAALINFGDVGILHGHFTDAKAEEIFLKILPEYDKAIEEPSFANRVQHVWKIFWMAEELWKPMAQKMEDDKKAWEEFKKLLEQLGSDQTMGSGSGEHSDNANEMGEDSEEGKESSEKKKTRQKKTIELTEKQYKGLKKLMEQSKGKGDGEGEEVEVKIVDEDGNEKDKTESSGNESDSKGSKNTDNNSDNKDKKSEDKEKMEDIEDYRNDPLDEAEAVAPAELSKPDIDAIRKDIEKSISEETNLEKRESDRNLPEDFEIGSHYFDKMKSFNHNADLEWEDYEALSDEYSEVCKHYKNEIQFLSKKLKRLTYVRPEELEHKTSGRLNLNRVASGKCTARVFDKRTVPDSADIAVFLLIDESGSMYGTKAQHARNASIAFAESCALAKIPLYVMGFSADETQYGYAEHYHYQKWKTSKKIRTNLCQITARSDNFDGYSIRYATRILNKRPEERKLLIVISDGQPAAQGYRSFSDGIEDTKKAIREAEKTGITVQGIAIGTDYETDEILESFYRNNFCKNTNLSDLLRELGQALTKRLK